MIPHFVLAHRACIEPGPDFGRPYCDPEYLESSVYQPLQLLFCGSALNSMKFVDHFVILNSTKDLLRLRAISDNLWQVTNSEQIFMFMHYSPRLFLAKNLSGEFR